MIVCHVDVYRSMRVHFLAKVDFVSRTDDDNVANRGSGSGGGGGGSDGTLQPTSRIRGYFHTRPEHVSAAYEPQLVDFSAIITELNKMQSINSPATVVVT